MSLHQAREGDQDVADEGEEERSQTRKGRVNRTLQVRVKKSGLIAREGR